MLGIDLLAYMEHGANLADYFGAPKGLADANILVLRPETPGIGYPPKTLP